MDDDEKTNLEVSQEELNAEKEATAEVKEDELRTKVAEDFGLDPEDEANKDLLEKLIAREKSHREKLSSAIKQKINWRERAERLPVKKEGKAPDSNVPDFDKLIDEKVNARLEAEEMKNLNLPDEIKTEVKELAKLRGITIKEASQLPYIRARVEEAEREKRIEEATPKRNNKGTYTPSYDVSKPLNPADFDFNSAEGVKAWKQAKADRDRYMAGKH